VKILQQARRDSFSGNALLIFLIRFFPSLANVLVIIYFSRHLPQEVYGAYQNFWVQLIVFSTIACVGFQAFIITYTPAFILSLIASLKSKHYYLFSGWVLSISAVFAALQLADGELPFLTSFSLILFYSLSVVAEALLISFKSYKWLFAVNKVYTVMFIILHLAFAGGMYGFEQLFLYLLALTILRFLLLLSTARNVIAAYTAPHTEPVDFTKVRSLWLHIGLYDVSQMLFRWIDKFVISLLFAREVSALYFNGSIDIPFLPLLLGAAASAALMQMAGAKDADKTIDTIKLLHHSSRILSSIVFPSFFFLLVFRYELFGVLLSEKYLAAVPIFLISILALPLRAYSFTTVLQNRHKGAIINKGALGDLAIACVLMYPGYLLLGLPGIALSFVLSSYLQAVYYLYHTASILNVPVLSLVPMGNWIIKTIVFAFLFIAFHYFTASFFNAQIVLLSGMLLTAMSIAVCLWLEYKATRSI
jgi:O-antigen/teichoic acid export membrane protein